MGRRRVAALALLFGGAAFIAAPVSEVAAAASGLSQAESESRDRGGPVAAGLLPGLVSEELTPPMAVPAVASGESYGLPVTGEGGAVMDPAAKVGEELVGDRTEFSQSFPRSDGMVEVRVSPDPIAFDAGGGEFELIDTSVEATRGGFRAVKNKFQVEFGSSDEGVTLVLESGAEVTSRPSLLDGVAAKGVVEPSVDAEDDSVVWFRQVWPGVDVRYTVRATGLSEDVVYTAAPAGAGAVSFAVSGAELDAVWSLPPVETSLEGARGVPERVRVASEVLADSTNAGKRSVDPVAEQETARLVANGERPEGAAVSLTARGELGVSSGSVRWR